MDQPRTRPDSLAARELYRVLTDREPFGPGDADSIIRAGCPGADLLFDRSNLIYAQVGSPSRPAYIIGRKGAGKTAFLLNSAIRDEQPPAVLRTAQIYSEMVAVLRRYRQLRGPLFVDGVAEVWLALFEHVALLRVYRTASALDPPNELQMLWDYLGRPPAGENEATAMAERFLTELQRRIANSSLVGLNEVIGGLSGGGVDFAQARKALHTVLVARAQSVTIVMDNLEDLHSHILELGEVLAGLFRCVGQTIAENGHDRTFDLQICLPSELFDEIHEVSANPEKDFRGNYLTIYWTARELLHLAGTRLRLYLQTHYPDRLDDLTRRIGRDESDVALLRAALPKTMRNGLGIEEDPVAYLLRHTQLLPRHLIEILNRVFTARVPDSTPWAISPRALLVGTRAAESMIAKGILAAHSSSFPMAKKALSRLSDRLGICFRANDLHKVFNQQSIKKLGLAFDEFLSMLFALGVVGVRTDQTERYNKAHFQYTFNSTLNAEEDTDHLCLHPLFTRYLHESSLSRLRRSGARPTYPYGCDPMDKDDYRLLLGYSTR